MRETDLRMETERLIVRRFEERDVPDILEYSRHEASDEHRRRNVGWEPTEESVRQWWAPMIAMKPEEAIQWLSLVVELKSQRRVIGNVGFNAKRIEDSFQGQIGWILGRTYEGRGYATEAVTALLDYLFRTVEFHRVYAMTSPDNRRSWRLMERLGMRREAHFVKNCHHDAGWTDEYVYAILAEEWAEHRPWSAT
jgi:RimJ/RimL family protein N-acetyltransferase